MSGAHTAALCWARVRPSAGNFGSIRSGRGFPVAEKELSSPWPSRGRGEPPFNKEGSPPTMVWISLLRRPGRPTTRLIHPVPNQTGSRRGYAGCARMSSQTSEGQVDFDLSKISAESRQNHDLPDLPDHPTSTISAIYRLILLLNARPAHSGTVPPTPNAHTDRSVMHADQLERPNGTNGTRAVERRPLGQPPQKQKTAKNMREEVEGSFRFLIRDVLRLGRASMTAQTGESW